MIRDLLLLSACLSYIQRRQTDRQLSRFSFAILLGALGRLGGEPEVDAKIVMGEPAPWLVSQPAGVTP